jgi:endonuclease YncB( thermonuclease family)
MIQKHRRRAGVTKRSRHTGFLRLGILSLVLVTLAAGAEAGTEPFQGKVIGISDGDTITVLRDHQSIKIRLSGIDAPEGGQPFGNRAKQFASTVAFGKIVTVKPRDTDRYGRTVADVILPDGRNLSHEIVRAGFAWWFRRYAPDDRALASLEAEARAARRGLWAEAGPIPPWEWRHPGR